MLKLLPMSLREPYVAAVDLVTGELAAVEHAPYDYAAFDEYARRAPTSAPAPIDVLACSRAAFVGPMPAGPLHLPTQASSVKDLSIFAHRGRSTAALESARLFFEGGGTDALIVRTESTEVEELCGNEYRREGIWSLINADINLISIPDTREMTLDDADTIIRAGIELADRIDALYLLDPPEELGTDPDDLDSWLPVTDRAAAYLPHLKRRGRPTLRRDHVGLSGAVAGIMARTEVETGVWKSPSGADSALEPKEWRVSEHFEGSARTQMRRLGVNLVRGGEDPVVWGSRTLMARGAINDEEKYISVMRTSSMLRRSIQFGIEWAILEVNGPDLWAQLYEHVSAFMHDLWQQGAFAGATPAESYFVQCDESTMVVRPGALPKILIGYAPIEPGKFTPVEVAFPTPRWLI